jgi:hypothetical protein
MRLHHLALLLIMCLALLGTAGCGQQERTVAAITQDTCGQLLRDTTKVHDQARVVVDQLGLRSGANAVGQAVLGVDLAIRRICRTAQAAYKPFKEVVAAAPAALVTAP